MKKPQTQTAIAKILAASNDGDILRVRFASITSKAWISKHNGEDVFADAVGDSVYGRHLSIIAKGESLDVEMLGQSDGKFKLHTSEIGYIWVRVEHIASVVALPSPVKVQPQGLAYEMTFNTNTGECKVGCQTLTRTGCEQAFKALGAHLGYEITD